MKTKIYKKADKQSLEGIRIGNLGPRGNRKPRNMSFFRWVQALKSDSRPLAHPIFLLKQILHDLRCPLPFDGKSGLFCDNLLR